MRATASDDRLSQGRRAWVLAMVSCWPAAVGAQATVAGGPAPVGAGQTRTTLEFRLADEAKGSFLTAEFRLRPRLRRAALVGPDGSVLDLTARLRRLPAEQARQPERGDLYLLSDPLRNPKAGRWQMVLDHEPAAAGHTVFWQAVQQPRFAARLSLVGGDRLRSNIDVDVLLELTDYGLPATNALPGSLRLTAPDGSQSNHVFRAGTEPGRYEARVAVRGTGNLDLMAEPQWPLAEGRKLALRVSRRWTVEPGPVGAAAALQTQLERDARACLQAVTFSLPWQADAAGPYVLSVLLGTVRVTGTTHVERAGAAVLTAVLRGSRLAAVSAGPVHQADVVEVVRAAGASDLLLRRSQVPISTPFNPADICR